MNRPEFYSNAPRAARRGAILGSAVAALAPWAMPLAVLPPMLLAVLLAVLLASCASGPSRPATPRPPVVDTAPPPSPMTPSVPDGPARPTGRGRWIATDWAALPGWRDDTVLAAWPALLRSCERPTALWGQACGAAKRLGPAADEARVRDYLQQQLQPWRVENNEGLAEGLITGYFEPLVEASRSPNARYNVPLYGVPAELALRKPWYTRAQIDTLPEAQAALKGRELAYVADPLDALLLQIQGSGRLLFTEPNGQRRTVRMAFAGHNDQPYQSIGRWLVDQGAFTLEQANWPAIRTWARNNPQRVREMLQVNPRFVFFREEALPDPAMGPTGAQGVALTPGRSIAVDKESIPYGTPVWIATTEPQPWSPSPPTPRPLQRLVIAQDTGNAITGAVRADYFWGWGEGAEDRAGRMKQPLRMWVLWPKTGS